MSIPAQLARTFTNLHDLVAEFIEELNQSEAIFRNQLSVERCASDVLRNDVGLERLNARVCESVCMQDSLDSQLRYIEKKLDAIEESITNFEKCVCIAAPHFPSGVDECRNKIYSGILESNAKINNLKNLSNELLDIKMEIKRSTRDVPFEYVAALMVKELEILENMENKIEIMKEHLGSIECKKNEFYRKYNFKSIDELMYT